MSKLNFASVSEAFTIGSEQLRNNKNEVDAIKKILTKNIEENKSKYSETTPEPPLPPPPPQQNDTEYTFFKLMNDPKFDDIVKNYVIFKHPEWILQKNSKEGFGNTTEIRNYIIFFIASIIFYMILNLFFKNSVSR